MQLQSVELQSGFWNSLAKNAMWELNDLGDDWVLFTFVKGMCKRETHSICFEYRTHWYSTLFKLYCNKVNNGDNNSDDKEELNNVNMAMLIYENKLGNMFYYERCYKFKVLARFCRFVCKRRLPMK